MSLSSTERKELREKIYTALNQIRPYLMADGGDIDFIQLTDSKKVIVKLLGACETCPMSMQTLKAGVEQSIRKIAPEITEVISIEDWEKKETQI